MKTFAPGALVCVLAAGLCHAQTFSGAERAAVLAELKPLQARLDTLRDDPKVSRDLWADADVFVKGVIWAADFGPISDAGGRELLRNGIRRARERVDTLRASAKPAWTARPGAVARGFVSEVDGSTQPYGLVVPAKYNPKKPTRLDVVLHGSSDDRAKGVAELHFLSQFDAGGDAGLPASAPDVNYLELHPLGRLGENAYRFEGETDVFEAIEAVCRNYNVDRLRIVLRGSSLGGVGTWQIGLKRPDRFVAIGPSAGPVDTVVFAASKRSNFLPLAPLTSWQKLLLHEVDAVDYAANAGVVPTVALMGEKDEYFPSHVLIRDAFAKEGVPFVGIVEPGVGHGPTPKATAAQLQVIEPHAQRGKINPPKRVRFVTWTLKFSSCFWVEILGLGTHYQRTEIDARLADDMSSVVIDREPVNITRFALSPPALTKLNSTLTIAGQNVELARHSPGETAAFKRTPAGWRYEAPREELELSGKRPGLQGPIDDAFSKRFLCVRGTGKALNPKVGAWADANLVRFADEWRRHYRGNLPVKKDVDVTPDDVGDCNLILFGDAGSNRIIRDVVPKLPIRWTQDELEIAGTKYASKDHAPELIYPNPLPDGHGHYVVINSGHTYHDYELQLSYMVYPQLGDWAVMKVGNNAPSTRPTVDETVVTSGFFDEDWKNPRVPH